MKDGRIKQAASTSADTATQDESPRFPAAGITRIRFKGSTVATHRPLSRAYPAPLRKQAIPLSPPV